MAEHIGKGGPPILLLDPNPGGVIEKVGHDVQTALAIQGSSEAHRETVGQF